MLHVVLICVHMSTFGPFLPVWLYNIPVTAIKETAFPEFPLPSGLRTVPSISVTTMCCTTVFTAVGAYCSLNVEDADPFVPVQWLTALTMPWKYHDKHVFISAIQSIFFTE